MTTTTNGHIEHPLPTWIDRLPVAARTRLTQMVTTGQTTVARLEAVTQPLQRIAALEAQARRLPPDLTLVTGTVEAAR